MNLYVEWDCLWLQNWLSFVKGRIIYEMENDAMWSELLIMIFGGLLD